jgi:hypothetical protein
MLGVRYRGSVCSEHFSPIQIVRYADVALLVVVVPLLSKEMFSVDVDELM